MVPGMYFMYTKRSSLWMLWVMGFHKNHRDSLRAPTCVSASGLTHALRPPRPNRAVRVCLLACISAVCTYALAPARGRSPEDEEGPTLSGASIPILGCVQQETTLSEGEKAEMSRTKKRLRACECCPYISPPGCFPIFPLTESRS